MRRIFIGGSVLLFGSVAIWLLSVSDVVCIARTGAIPDVRDRVSFLESVGAMRVRTVEALVRAYDAETHFFIYSKTPFGTRSEANNDIRQLLASRVLALESVNDEALRSLHRENLTAILDNWYQESGIYGYVFVDGKSKLGANALLLRVLVYSPFFDEYRAEADKLTQTIMSLQQNDGLFKAWFREPDYAYDEDYLLTFYSGEAILALLEYAEKTGDSTTLRAATRAQDAYLKQYVEDMSENYYPAYVPWHTLSLALLYERTKEQRYGDAIFILNDRLLELQDTTEFVGRFYNPATPEYGSPHASSDAIYTEGLARAFGIARRIGDSERSARYDEALQYAVHNLASLAYTPSWHRIFDDAGAEEMLRNGIHTNHCDSRIRIDSTAHTADALDAILKSEGIDN